MLTPLIFQAIRWPGSASVWRVLAIVSCLCASQAAFGDPTANLSVDQLKQLSLEQLLNVDVTSVSRHPQKWLEVPSAIQVVTGEDIERSGAMTIPEALRLAPNLDVAQKNPHDWGVSARGFNAALANKLLVMIDGRTVYTPLFSGVFWDVQDYLLHDLDRIEIVSGPGATLWGANAVNGVINITSKSAKDTPGLYVEGGGGTEWRDFAAVRYGTTITPNVYLRVYGKTFDGDNAVFANGAEAPDSWTMRRGGFRLDADLPADTGVTLQGDMYQGSEYIVTGGIQRVSGGNLLGRWSRTWSPDEDMRVQVYYDRTHLADPITNPFGSVKYLNDDLDTYDVDFQHRFPIGEYHQLIWGAGYRLTHDAVRNAPNTAFLPPNVDHQLFSAFTQDEITLSPSLLLTLGTKVEHNDYTGIEVEPSARLSYRLSDSQTLWTAVSRAVRMPARYDRDIFLPNPPPVVASGNKDFASETLMAYEAGYRMQLARGLSGSVSVFYNDYHRLRSFGPAAGTARPIFLANNLYGETHGLELSTQYQVLPSWRLRADYDLLLEHLHLQPGAIDIYGGRNEVSDPRHQATLQSFLDLPAHLSFDPMLRWVDTLPTPGGSVPSYAELDARIAWRPNDRWEFSVVGQNLLHPHHPEFGIAIPRREELQRSGYAKVSVRF